jgi:hypothetical protein
MFTFLNACDGEIVVTVDNEKVGSANTAEGLAEIFTEYGCTAGDIYHSSDVDFASEEGFDTDDCAHNIINSALEMA